MQYNQWKRWKSMKLYDELKWRGISQDVSSPELEEKLNNGGLKFYIGTDPTADSLHIGHYASFLICLYYTLNSYCIILIITFNVKFFQVI